MASALNVLYRDTTQIMEFIVFVWFYITPVLYDVAEVFKVGLPKWATLLYTLNPMVGITEWYRLVFLKSHLITAQMVGLEGASSTFSHEAQSALVFGYIIPYSTGISLAVFFIGMWVFKRLETRVVDAM